MKLLNTKCPRCGGSMSIDETTKKAVCEFCRYETVVDDEVLHIQHDNVMQNGYEFEKGRIQARKEEELEKAKIMAEMQLEESERLLKNIEEAKQKEREEKLKKPMIITAILCFPIAIYLYLFKFAKFKNMEVKKKYIIIAISIVAYIIMLAIGAAQSEKEERAKETSSITYTIEKTVNRPPFYLQIFHLVFPPIQTKSLVPLSFPFRCTASE